MLVVVRGVRGATHWAVVRRCLLVMMTAEHLQPPSWSLMETNQGVSPGWLGLEYFLTQTVLSYQLPTTNLP